MDLRLHHPHRAGQPLRGLDRLVGREGGRALGHRHAVARQHLLGLILVDVHQFIRVTSKLASDGRMAVISISTFAPIGSAATAIVERAG